MFQVSGNSDDEDDDTDDEDNMETGSGTSRVARKRKQLLESGGAGSGGCGNNSSNNRNNLSTSPTSSPSKRARKIKSPMPTSGSAYHTPMSTSASSSALGLLPMSAPAKICQTSPALDLLETKKKVQRNSLYHWVLWREALRGEKDRTNNPNAPHPQSPR